MVLPLCRLVLSPKQGREGASPDVLVSAMGIQQLDSFETHRKFRSRLGNSAFQQSKHMSCSRSVNFLGTIQVVLYLLPIGLYAREAGKSNFNDG